MSVYEYEDVTIFEGVIIGDVENAPPITQPLPDWWPLRDQVYEAARAVVRFSTVSDFHLVHRAEYTGNVTCIRWVVQAEMFGPELRWQETSGASRMVFHLRRAVGVQEFRMDPDNPMPWFDFRDAFPVVLGRQALGTLPLHIPFDNSADIIFTPQQVEYSRYGYNDVTEPCTAPTHVWTFNAEPIDPVEPALWMVPAGQATGVKLSRCVDSGGSMWSDASEPAPSFEPLPPPPGNSP